MLYNINPLLIVMVFISESVQQKYSQQDGEAIAKDLTRGYYVFSRG